ncbi:hypothetical protein MTP03_30790 [Tsukamurella sp. PLM1]|nr:hypothetical protein MTP03_30790 [Tsukamurella sp. PLM1]
MNAGVSQLSTGLSQLSAGLGQVKTGTDQVVEMTGRLQEGLGAATDYLTGLSAGTTDGPGRGFYLPAQGLQSDRFVDGSRVLMSPDGRSARILVVWGINPYSDEALNTAASIPDAARAAAHGTVLESATMDGFGLASISAQMREQVLRDFLLFGLVAVIGVFLVLLVLLRAVIAAALMVATVVLSFAAAAGASVLLWQHGLGIPVDWSVLPIAFMALVAVGADYSMLFADRIREEAAGDSTVRGVLRAFGTTGSVITTAGLVFAITMFALMSGSVINLLQIGSTIGIGLLIDIVVVRTVFVPAAITALGDRVVAVEAVTAASRVRWARDGAAPRRTEAKHRSAAATANPVAAAANNGPPTATAPSTEVPAAIPALVHALFQPSTAARLSGSTEDRYVCWAEKKAPPPAHHTAIAAMATAGTVAVVATATPAATTSAAPAGTHAGCTPRRARRSTSAPVATEPVIEPTPTTSPIRPSAVRP